MIFQVYFSQCYSDVWCIYREKFHDWHLCDTPCLEFEIIFYLKLKEINGIKSLGIIQIILFDFIIFAQI